MIRIDEKGRLWGRVSIVDLVVLLFLLFLAIPAFLYGLQIFTQTPVITRITPERIWVDDPQKLTIFGRCFHPKSVVKIGKMVLRDVTFRPGRLEVERLPQEINGLYTVSVVNPGGLMAKSPSTLEILSSVPEVHAVYPKQIPANQERRLTIHGKYFLEDTDVSLGGVTLERLRYVSPTHFEATVPSNRFKPGRYSIQMTNAYEQSGVLKNAIEVMPAPHSVKPPPHSQVGIPPPLLTKAPGKSQIPTIPAIVICSFREPDMEVKAKMLKVGAVHRILDDGSLVGARILEILSKESVVRPEMYPRERRRMKGALGDRVIVARLELLGEVQPWEGGESFFYYLGQPVTAGSWVSFTFHALDIEGVVLADPVILTQEGGNHRGQGEVAKLP